MSLRGGGVGDGPRINKYRAGTAAYCGAARQREGVPACHPVVSPGAGPQERPGGRYGEHVAVGMPRVTGRGRVGVESGAVDHDPFRVPDVCPVRDGQWCAAGEHVPGAVAGARVADRRGGAVGRVLAHVVVGERRQVGVERVAVDYHPFRASDVCPVHDGQRCSAGEYVPLAVAGARVPDRHGGAVGRVLRQRVELCIGEGDGRLRAADVSPVADVERRSSHDPEDGTVVGDECAVSYRRLHLKERGRVPE